MQVRSVTFRAAAAPATAAPAVAACSGAATPTPLPAPSATPTTAPSVAPAGSQAPAASATPTPALSVAAALIPDGRYVSRAGGPGMNGSLRALALLLAAGLTAVACSSPSAASPNISSLAPSIAVASAASTATPGSTPVQSVAPSASASLQVIPEGTYVGSPIRVADIRALIMADKKLTAAEKTDLIDNEFGLDDHTTSVGYMDFHAGQLIVGGSYDGGPRDVGARATYVFPDAHTLVIQEQCCGLTTFQITVTGTSFTLKRLSATQSTETDVIGTKVVYELTPFMREP